MTLSPDAVVPGPSTSPAPSDSTAPLLSEDLHSLSSDEAPSDWSSPSDDNRNDADREGEVNMDELDEDDEDDTEDDDGSDLARRPLSASDLGFDLVAGPSALDSDGGALSSNASSVSSSRAVERQPKAKTKKRQGRGRTASNPMRLSFPDPLDPAALSDPPSLDSPTTRDVPRVRTESSTTRVVRQDLDNSILIDGGAYSLLLDAPTALGRATSDDREETTSTPPPAETPRSTAPAVHAAPSPFRTSPRSSLTLPSSRIVRAKSTLDKPASSSTTAYSSASVGIAKQIPTPNVKGYDPDKVGQWVRSTRRVAPDDRNKSIAEAQTILSEAQDGGQRQGGGQDSLVGEREISSVHSSQTVVPHDRSPSTSTHLSEKHVTKYEPLSEQEEKGEPSGESSARSKNEAVSTGGSRRLTPTSSDLTTSSILNRFLVVLTFVGVGLAALSAMTDSARLSSAPSTSTTASVPTSISTPLRDVPAVPINGATLEESRQRGASSARDVLRIGSTEARARAPTIQAAPVLMHSTAPRRGPPPIPARLPAPPPTYAIDPPQAVLRRVARPGSGGQGHGKDDTSRERVPSPGRGEDWPTARQGGQAMRRRMEEHARRCQVARSPRVESSEDGREARHARPRSGSVKRRRRAVLELARHGPLVGRAVDGLDEVLNVWTGTHDVVAAHEQERLRVEEPDGSSVDDFEREGSLLYRFPSYVKDLSRDIALRIKYSVVDLVEPIRPPGTRSRLVKTDAKTGRQREDSHRLAHVAEYYPTIRDYYRTTQEDLSRRVRQAMSRADAAYSRRDGIRKHFAEGRRSTRREVSKARKAVERLRRRAGRVGEDRWNDAIAAYRRAAPEMRRRGQEVLGLALEKGRRVGQDLGQETSKRTRRHVERAARTVERAKRKALERFGPQEVVIISREARRKRERKRDERKEAKARRKIE
ncbi:hypothetical protein JCM10212_000949 [Sporobolomyces blumeae]